jgi:hypothetical protein
MYKAKAVLTILRKKTVDCAVPTPTLGRVARFFLVQAYQIGKNITNDNILYQTAMNYTKWP